MTVSPAIPMNQFRRWAGSQHIMLVVLAFAIMVISIRTIAVQTLEPAGGDGYENYAYALAEWGVFGRAEDSEQPPPSGVGRAPVYPAFLAAIMQVSPLDKARAKCVVDEAGECETIGGIAPAIQLAIMAVSIFLIFSIGIRMGAAPWASALFSTMAALPLLKLTYQYQFSEAIALPLFGISSWLLIRWFAGAGRSAEVALLGATIGLLSLTRVAYEYAVPFVTLAILFMQPALPKDFRQRMAAAALALAGFLAVTTPWQVRNIVTLGETAESDSGVASVLAFRVSYNRMTLEEAVVGIVYFLPGFGDSLAKQIFTPEVVSKFDFENPKGFRQQGRALLEEKRRTTETDADLKEALLVEMVKSPTGHLLATVPLAVDGLRYVFWMLPFSIIAVVKIIRGRAWWILAASILTIFNFAFHAALTHFRARYGLPMVLGFAPLAALGMTMLTVWLWQRRTGGSPRLPINAQADHSGSLL